MTVLESCQRCRTVLVPGQGTCLKCGATAGQPTVECPACHRPTGTDAAYCPGCGHAMREPTEPAVPQPPPPAAQAGAFVTPRTPGARAYLTVGVVIALVVGLLGGLYAVQQSMYGPEAAIGGYFDALTNRDAKAALSYLDSTDPDEGDPYSTPGEDDSRSMLTDAVLKGDGYQPPTAVKIVDVDVTDSGESADAEVTYHVGDRTHEATLSLQREEEATYGVFHEWRLSGAVTRMVVAGLSWAPVTINGVKVEPRTDSPVGGSGPQVTVFPGRYSVALADNPLLEAEALTLSVGSEAVRAELEPQLKDSAREEAEEQVAAYLDECAESTELEPEGCPFSTYSYDTVTDVEWTIDQYPSILVELGSEGYVAVKSVESGVASVTWKDSDGKKQDDETTFHVYGTVAASPSGVTFYPPN